MTRYKKNGSVFSLVFALVFFCINGFANAKGKMLSYKVGENEFESYYVGPKGKAKAAVVLIHDWMGLSEFTMKKADEIAAEGYAVLAADLYGKGQRPKDGKEAGAFSGALKKDRAVLRARAQAALEQLQAQIGKGVPSVAAGFCFGGTAALEMGRGGMNLSGIASFHGGLDNPNPADVKNIKAKVLVMHGAIDPYVSSEEVQNFQKEMNEAKIDYQFISYSGAVHAFTNPAAGSDNSKGAAFNEAANRRSWIAFYQFMKEISQK